VVSCDDTVESASGGPSRASDKDVLAVVQNKSFWSAESVTVSGDVDCDDVARILRPMAH